MEAGVYSCDLGEACRGIGCMQNLESVHKATHFKLSVSREHSTLVLSTRAGHGSWCERCQEQRRPSRSHDGKDVRDVTLEEPGSKCTRDLLFDLFHVSSTFLINSIDHLDHLERLNMSPRRVTIPIAFPPAGHCDIPTRPDPLPADSPERARIQPLLDHFADERLEIPVKEGSDEVTPIDDWEKMFLVRCLWHSCSKR